MPSPINEETMIERRDEIQKALEDLDQQRAQMQRELQAINLYLGALKGELPTAGPAPAPKPEPKAHRAAIGPRAPRGERRGHIMDILRQEPDGYPFDRILEILGVSDSREQKAVYAALHNMKRKGEIVQHPNKHFAVASTEEEASEPVEAAAKD